MTKDLPPGTTLLVCSGDKEIFSSSGKWLHPLFELEDFFKTYTGSKKDLSAHDTAIGKAAAVLMTRLGIKKMHGDITSTLALNYIKKNHPDSCLTFTYQVPRLLCATEEQLENLDDSDEMYYLLRQRAKLTQGVSVEVKNIFHPHGQVRDFSFSLPAGGRLIVEGENGAGKTTLLTLLAGIAKPSSGSILIDGLPVKKLKPLTIGYIPQFAGKENFSLSVEEVISLGIPSGTKNRTELIHKNLKRTSSLHLAKRDFSSLSGGEKQKVSVARCLAQKAKLLLLDEPTASLDSANKKMVMEIIRSLSLTEIPTIIIVTHDRELASLGGWSHLSLGGTQ